MMRMLIFNKWEEEWIEVKGKLCVQQVFICLMIISVIVINQHRKHNYLINAMMFDAICTASLLGELNSTVQLRRAVCLLSFFLCCCFSRLSFENDRMRVYWPISHGQSWRREWNEEKSRNYFILVFLFCSFHVTFFTFPFFFFFFSCHWSIRVWIVCKVLQFAHPWTSWKIAINV